MATPSVIRWRICSLPHSPPCCATHRTAWTWRNSRRRNWSFFTSSFTNFMVAFAEVEADRTVYSGCQRTIKMAGRGQLKGPFFQVGRSARQTCAQRLPCCRDAIGVDPRKLRPVLMYLRNRVQQQAKYKGEFFPSTKCVKTLVRLSWSFFNWIRTPKNRKKYWLLHLDPP